MPTLAEVSASLGCSSSSVSLSRMHSKRSVNAAPHDSSACHTTCSSRCSSAARHHAPASERMRLLKPCRVASTNWPIGLAGAAGSATLGFARRRRVVGGVRVVFSGALSPSLALPLARSLAPPPSRAGCRPCLCARERSLYHGKLAACRSCVLVCDGAAQRITGSRGAMVSWRCAEQLKGRLLSSRVWIVRRFQMLHPPRRSRKLLRC